MTERLADIEQTNISAAEILAPCVTGPVDASDMDLLEIARNVAESLYNTQALVNKLQHLLTSKTHECEALRAQVAAHRAEFSLQNVGLAELLEEAATHLEDGMRVTLHPPGANTSATCVLHAIGSDFSVFTHELSSAISCAAELAAHQV